MKDNEWHNVVNISKYLNAEYCHEVITLIILMAFERVL